MVSGGDVANVPWPRLESFVARLLEIDTVRDIRLATKALMGLPQHWLTPRSVEGVNRLARTARDRGINLAIHTHVNAAQSGHPAGGRGDRGLLDAGVRDVRNQGVLHARASTTTPATCSTCASRCRTRPRSCRTTSTSAT